MILPSVGNPRLYDHPYQSPQLSLWEAGEVEWHVIIRCESPTRRRKWSSSNRYSACIYAQSEWASVTDLREGDSTE